MPILDLILLKVRQSDLEKFREKILTMEENAEEKRKKINKLNYSEVLESRQKKFQQDNQELNKTFMDLNYEEIYTEEEIEQNEEIGKSEMSDKEIFQKFLEELK